MPLIQLIVLAIVQGITEFLPISSSAHLILAPLLIDEWSDQGAIMDVAAHIGTLFAVLIYFRSETATLCRGGIDALRFKASADRKLFLQIALASVPVVLVGAVVALTGMINYLRSPYVIAWASIFFGILLWHADRALGDKEGLQRISWREAVVIGLAQMLAIVPGTSRSGVTITAARYLGWSRTEAARFSILLAIPSILAIGGFAALELFSEGNVGDMRAVALMAALSFIVALLTISVFMNFTRKLSFTPFVIYRVLMGLALLAIAPRLVAA
ncbi:MAG: undecaprenyl-diphosphate phosphatase [Parvularculaceae bacterium]|nr:MAG: undecaprenyl-diphosphate phosphatase [Parvularculaceae bacterium]